MLVLTGSEIVGKASTLVLFVVLSRALGLTGFGTFSFGLGLGLLLAAIPSMGLDITVVQRGSQEPTAVGRLVAELLTLRIMLGATTVVAAGVVIGVSNGYDELGWSVLLLIVAGVAETFTQALRAACQARQQQIPTGGVLVAQRLVTLALVCGALAAGTGLLGSAAAYLAGTATGLGGMAWAAHRAQASPRWKEVHRAGVISLLAAARVVGVDALVTSALLRVDVVLIQAFAGPAAVGVYTAAYRLVETVLFVAWSINRTMVPMMAAAGRSARFTLLSQLSVELSLFVYAPYAVALFLRGEDLVRLLFGTAYADAGVMRWLALAPLLLGLAEAMSAALLSQRPDPAVLWASTAALVVNVGVNLILIPSWGASGAAAATSAAHLVEVGVLAVVLLRMVRPPVDHRAGTVIVLAIATATPIMLAPLPIAASLGIAAVAYLLVWLSLTRWSSPARLAFLRGAFLPQRRTA